MGKLLFRAHREVSKAWGVKTCIFSLAPHLPLNFASFSKAKAESISLPKYTLISRQTENSQLIFPTSLQFWSKYCAGYSEGYNPGRKRSYLQCQAAKSINQVMEAQQRKGGEGSKRECSGTSVEESAPVSLEPFMSPRHFHLVSADLRLSTLPTTSSMALSENLPTPTNKCHLSKRSLPVHPAKAIII